MLGQGPHVSKKVWDNEFVVLVLWNNLLKKKRYSPILGQFLEAKVNDATCEMIMKHLVTSSYGHAWFYASCYKYFNIIKLSAQNFENLILTQKNSLLNFW
jgi:hypothetical protein